jgi:hypothetical protein
VHTKTNPIELFFMSPATPGQAVGVTNYSPLYLLRRDVNFCFGIDHPTGQRRLGAEAALFPGTMAIMAGSSTYYGQPFPLDDRIDIISLNRNPRVAGSMADLWLQDEFPL